METETRDLVRSNPQPDLGRIKALVLDSVKSAHTRRAYEKALNDFLAWYLTSAPGEFTKDTVQRYARMLEDRGLAASTINVRLTAVRRLAAQATDNGLLEPRQAAGISRVKGAKPQCSRAGNWLTVDEVERLINTPDTSQLKGRRDRALLAVLIGCGLRRSEVSDLTVEHIQQRDGRWAIADLHGTGNRIRIAPMPSWTKTAIDRWSEAAQITHGRVFRPMNNRHQVSGDVLLPQNIMEAVANYGLMIGVPKLAPHDLRRTFAILAHKGGAALEQIQVSLGHASILTTERYLGVRQDLQDAPCDHLGIHIPAA